MNDYFIEYLMKTKAVKGVTEEMNIYVHDPDVIFTTKVVSAGNAVEAVKVVEDSHECFIRICSIKKI